MSSPLEEKKRKESSLLLPHNLQFLSLPNELVLSCLARVPKSYYPTLSLFCKSFRSLLASPELYQTRPFLNRTESFLYVCLEFPLDYNPRWFTLCGRPNQTLSNDPRKKEKETTGNILVPIPSPSSFLQVGLSSVVVVGYYIHEIGGSINGVPSSRVSVLDCTSHTWHEAPNMWEERDCLSANVIDGKIYVVGGRKKGSGNLNLIEVFDPKTQTWTPFSGPGKEVYYDDDIFDTLVIDGKLYIYGRTVVSYNPKDGKFEPEKRMKSMIRGFKASSYCVINNMFFYYQEGVFKWYDTKIRKLKGLKELHEFPRDSDVNLGEYGGKMVVFWDEYLPHIKCTRIWCAEIALERCNNEDEISGKVMWFGVVFESHC